MTRREGEEGGRRGKGTPQKRWPGVVQTLSLRHVSAHATGRTEGRRESCQAAAAEDEKRKAAFQIIPGAGAQRLYNVLLIRPPEEEKPRGSFSLTAMGQNQETGTAAKRSAPQGRPEKLGKDSN